MEHKISLEELIEKLTEIRDRFKKGQPKILTTTGIVFGYRDSAIDGGIDFHMSRECLNDLESLYMDSVVDDNETCKVPSFTYYVKGEINILEMVIKSKAIGWAEQTTDLFDLMRANKFCVNGQIINNIFYMVSDGDVVDIKDTVHIKIKSSDLKLTQKVN